MDSHQHQTKKRQMPESSSISGTGEGCVAVYRFCVLLPNRSTVRLSIRGREETEMELEEFAEMARKKYMAEKMEMEGKETTKRRKVMWKSEELWLEDVKGRKVKGTVKLREFGGKSGGGGLNIVKLHDGSGQVAETYKNMWDLTPSTELLMELPEEYTFETALADLIDNSLQAVWANAKGDTKLIRVDIDDNCISIFDTGPGMDGSTENCISKWGIMGASRHRTSRVLAVGGKPPYLKPFFGMFGYGGPIASMHLGRQAIVSAKTKESKEVWSLNLQRDALLKFSGSGSKRTWKADGGHRPPTKFEVETSPHGTFTKVDIIEPKLKVKGMFLLQCQLKDIYFPYIQCDEISQTGRTMALVDFQVNGTSLAEIDGGEVATTNLHSCNGPEFVLQLHFVRDDKNPSGGSSYQEANARIKCIYYPFVEGKENIDRILEKLRADGFRIKEDFRSFSHVSIRRLGRLLPDARWTWLPFMAPKLKRGDKAQILKRCWPRVKCFVDTDAGFTPTASKTDLSHQSPFTKALKNLGEDSAEKETGVRVEISRAGKRLSVSQLETEYQEWILRIHSAHDEEFDCGDDQPVFLVSLPNKKELGVNSDVVRVHKMIKRKGACWRAEQRVKILKGAGPGCYKNNMFVTLEYFLLEGLQGDAGGNARVICRPLGVDTGHGCLLKVDDRGAIMVLQSSLSLNITVMEKCVAVGSSEWRSQVDKRMSYSIEILDQKQCQELEVDGALPMGSPILAGHVPPKEVFAVIRPSNYTCSSTDSLDKKHIQTDNSEMCMDVYFEDKAAKCHSSGPIFSCSVSNTSRNGFPGLYTFPLGTKIPDLFRRAGEYIFSFSLKQSAAISCKQSVFVKATSFAGRWELSEEMQNTSFRVRVGSCFPAIFIVCRDEQWNHMAFKSIPDIAIKLMSYGKEFSQIKKFKVDLSSDRLSLNIQNLFIHTKDLDKLRPAYKVTVVISNFDNSHKLHIPSEVLPGALQHVTLCPLNLQNDLVPGRYIENLRLELFDAYSNHVEEGLEVGFIFDGFYCQGGEKHKVDGQGFIDLSGLLKVIKGYGKTVSLSVKSGRDIVFTEVLQTEKRELKLVSKIPEFCSAGSKLENIVFEAVNSKGVIDKTFHDTEKQNPVHKLVIEGESFDLGDSCRSAFKNGQCIFSSIPLPKKEGSYWLVAAHSSYPELSFKFKVTVIQSPEKDCDSITCTVLASYDELMDIAPQTSYGEIMHSPHARTLDRVEALSIIPPSDVCTPDIILSQDVSTLECFGMAIAPFFDDLKDLDKGVHECGLRIKDHEDNIRLLSCRRDVIERDISVLRDYSSQKELMLNRVESKPETVAAVHFDLSRSISSQEWQRQLSVEIIGCVSLLATAPNHALSCTLADYLGEDTMLAIVCQSNAPSTMLEIYEQVLNSLQKESGKVFKGRHLFIGLEDIKSYEGEFIEYNGQIRLALTDPILPTGTTARGFLGYAVNMIDIAIDHLGTKTAAGHGLRETLFYRLFGKLQVYETKESMKEAYPCVTTDGAVSLDGGIIRGNGVLSLGHGEPEIFFPVVSESLVDISEEGIGIQEEIEAKMMELKKIDDARECLSQKRAKSLKKFEKVCGKYLKYCDNKEAVQKVITYSSSPGWEKIGKK
ncbi:Structural maintenance of chromosomes flexible hinge domain-containing protein [Drosera capensis]